MTPELTAARHDRNWTAIEHLVYPSRTPQIMSGRTSASLGKASSRAAPDPAFQRSPLLSSSFLADRLQADVSSLDDLEHAWRPLALRGNANAADRVLAIQRQRAAVLQLALQAAAQPPHP